MHSDPNPGNYLFREDGTVAVIDFGSAKIFRPEFAARILSLWRAHIHDDHGTIIDHYCDMGMDRGDRKLAEETFRTRLVPFTEWLRLPYREKTFDFGKHADYCTNGPKVFGSMVQLRAMDVFTAEGILFDRNIYGLYRLFTELKAQVRMRNEWVF